MLPVMKSIAAMQAALFMALVSIASPVFAQIEPPPAPANLRAQPGDGEVILTWDDPNDPSLTGYEFRTRITDQVPENWRPDWTFIAAGGEDSDATTTRVRVSQLGNCINFTFGIRAVRGSDRSVKGAAAHVTATPKVSSCPPPPPPPPPRPPSTGGGGGSSRDDHGNTAARATAVSLDETTPWRSSTAGQINTRRDVDYFTLTAPHAGVLLVGTIGSTDTQGTVWQDDEELAMADSGGTRQNFRLSVRVEAGPVVIAVAGNGRRTGNYTLQTSLLAGYLENPGPESFQSGIGVLSGWVCAAEEIEIAIGDTATQVAAYGTERVDTAAPCGETNTGFGLLYNWNHLEDGEHTVIARVNGVELGRAVVDGIEFGRATVTVTTLGTEFLEDVAGECTVEHFPMDGETVRLVWQQTNQNFMIAGESAPSGENRAGIPGIGYLENPGANSFQSGLGVISGWVCEAETVEIELGELGRQGAAYGTERLDTAESCGDTDNGFGLLFNWNRLGEGDHEIVAYVDNSELGRATVRVTTLGAEFLEEVAGECVVEDFPSPGERVTVEWQQNNQNFVIISHDPDTVGP